MIAPRIVRECSHTRSRHEHGTNAAYNLDRCRCRPCTDAAAASFRRLYRRRAMIRHGAAPPMFTQPHGTRRRLEALAAIGWHDHEIGSQLGVTASAVGLLRRDQRRCLTSTAERIAAVYDQMSMTVHPRERFRTRRINQARGFGWAPPLAWDDDTIDLEDAEPQHNAKRVHTPGRPEVDSTRVDEILRLTRRGLSAEDIALRLRITGRTVVRYRAAARRDEAAA